MKMAVCYYSRHHGNTLKVLQAMARETEMDLIDVTVRRTVRLEDYDCIGFAAGISGFEFQKAVVDFARQYLPAGKPVFFVYTYGGAKGSGTRSIAAVAEEKGCPVWGEFGCRGYCTFGPFRLVGGVAKGRPDARDLEDARQFCRDLLQRHNGGNRI